MRVRGLELEERFETLVNPRRPLPAADRRADRDRPERAARRTAGRARGASFPRVRRRRGARRAQRALRHRLPRPRGRAADRDGASPRRSSTPSGSRADCSPAGVQRVGLASLAHFFGTSTRPCHRALADAEATAEILLAADRSRAGARRSDRRRPRRPRRAARAQAARASARSSPARRSGRASTSSATATSRCSTSAAPATSARGCARTSGPSGSGPPSRRRLARSSGSSGACSAPSSRLRSRSCACCASCGRRRTRAARGPIATSTCAGAEPAGASPDTPGPHGPLKSRGRRVVAARALDGLGGRARRTPCRRSARS